MPYTRRRSRKASIDPQLRFLLTFLCSCTVAFLIIYLAMDNTDRLVHCDGPSENAPRPADPRPSTSLVQENERINADQGALGPERYDAESWDVKAPPLPEESTRSSDLDPAPHRERRSGGAAALSGRKYEEVRAQNSTRPAEDSGNAPRAEEKGPVTFRLDVKKAVNGAIEEDATGNARLSNLLATMNPGLRILGPADRRQKADYVITLNQEVTQKARSSETPTKTAWEGHARLRVLCRTTDREVLVVSVPTLKRCCSSFVKGDRVMLYVLFDRLSAKLKAEPMFCRGLQEQPAASEERDIQIAGTTRARPVAPRGNLVTPLEPVRQIPTSVTPVQKPRNRIPWSYRDPVTLWVNVTKTVGGEQQNDPAKRALLSDFLRSVAPRSAVIPRGGRAKNADYLVELELEARVVRENRFYGGVVVSREWRGQARFRIRSPGKRSILYSMNIPGITKSCSVNLRGDELVLKEVFAELKKRLEREPAFRHAKQS